MKKILYFSPGFFHAREDLFIRLSKEFDIRFIEASNYMNGTPSDRYKSMVNYEIWEYNSFRLSKLKIKYIFPLFVSIIKELNKARYDIVISSTQHPLYAKILFLLRPFYRYKLAYVNEVWNYEYQKRGLLAKIYEKISMHIVKRADYVLNEGIRSNEFMIKNGVKPSKCHIWPMVSVDLKQKEIIPHDGLRQSFARNEDKIKFAFIGRLTEPKGVLTLCEAYKLLPQDYKLKSMMYIIGKGPLFDYLIDFKKECPNVEVFEWLNSTYLPYLYSNLDFFINPSHFDGFSTVACEAASMSVPLILTDKVGCVPDLLRDEVGIVVKENHPQMLADAIVKMMETHKNELVNDGEIIRKNFEEISSIDINVDTIRRIINE